MRKRYLMLALILAVITTYFAANSNHTSDKKNIYEILKTLIYK
ncbi:hypothetical protein [Scopulibacillus cellulosilyticus]|uniref:Uncharacterized protein n=1 Tax=Scopulibacillus cellulosilyticus TaxID=2665665 RepID=A0ABW2PXL9_9BACL